MGALLHHLSDVRIERLLHGQNKPADPAAATLLAQFIEGGLRAVLTAKARPLSASQPRKTPTTRNAASLRMAFTRPL